MGKKKANSEGKKKLEEISTEHVYIFKWLLTCEQDEDGTM